MIISAEQHVVEAEGLWQDTLLYPLGFPIRLVTNSKELLNLAAVHWSKWEKLFNDPPLDITLAMIGTMSSPERCVPTVDTTGKILRISFDTNNLITADLSRGLAQGQFSMHWLRHKERFCYYVLDAVALSMISSLRALALHAACVEWSGAGMLLCGESGAGKTSLAYACASSQWRFLSDDATYLCLNARERFAIGNNRQIRFRDAATAIFPELQGRMVTSRPDGKASIEIATGELRHIQCVHSTTIQHIVFLNRSSNREPGLYPYTKSSAMQYFERFLVSRPDEIAIRALSRLVAAGTYELCYKDLHWAVSKLQKLVKR